MGQISRGRSEIKFFTKCQSRYVSIAPKCDHSMFSFSYLESSFWEISILWTDKTVLKGEIGMKSISAHLDFILFFYNLIFYRKTF